nr:reverse transcriptase domain-containing protein [Tanacetum cinerariifolium]
MIMVAQRSERAVGCFVPYFNQLELVYGRDIGTGVVAEGFKDAIHSLEEEQNGEIGGENLGESHFSLSDEEDDKAANEKLKDCLDELVKLKILTGDVLHAGEIFAANKEKLDLFINIPDELQVSYVYKLMGLSSDITIYRRRYARIHSQRASTDTLGKRHNIAKRRHGKRASMQVVFILKAKSDSAFDNAQGEHSEKEQGMPYKGPGPPRTMQGGGPPKVDGYNAYNRRDHYDGRSTYYGGIATCTHRGLGRGNLVPPILAEQFELKHILINMMTLDQFFGLKKNNPHDHIRCFNKITFAIKYKDVLNSAIKLMLFPFSLAEAARRWLEKEPSRSILTWEDLVSKFINEFFPPSRTTNLRNEISNFQQRFDESFHEAWDRHKDLLRVCPRYGFTELHQLDTFYNALNLANQDSLNSDAGGNLLERRTQDVLTIIENKSKQTSAVTTAMTAILKQFQATPPPAFIKAVEEICVTCGGAHPYYQCLAAGGNTFPELRDNIQGYVAATAVNYNQGNSGYCPSGVANQIRPLGFAQPNVQNNQNRFSQPQGYNRGNNFNQDQSYQAPTQQNQVVPLSSGSLPSNTIANWKGELKSITTRSGIVIDGPFVPIPPPFINPEEDEHVEETLTDQDLAEYTIKYWTEPTIISHMFPQDNMVGGSLEDILRNPRIVYPPILDINYFRHFLDIFQNYDPMDVEPTWAADRVVALTHGFAITIPETANEFAIKEAKTWLDKLNEGITKTWDELQTVFISQFFPPTLFDRLLREIQAFSQHENESITDAWLRMKEILQNCHGHNMFKGNIIKIFDHGLSEITQEVLNAAAGGIFLYKTPNQAYQLLEDKVLLKLDWAKNHKTKSSLKKTVAFIDEVQRTQSCAKKPTPDLDDDDTSMSRKEEAKLMQTFHNTRFYNDYHDRDSNRDNWHSSGRNDYNRDNYRSNTDDKSYDLKNQFNDFMKSQQSTKAFVKETFMDLKTQLETVAKNNQASTQNLKIKLTGLLTSNLVDLLDLFQATLNQTYEVATLKLTKHHNLVMSTNDVIDEILKEDFNALLDEERKILHYIEGTLLKEEIFSKFDEFMAMTANENSESESDTDKPPFEKITINTDYKIKTSLEEPPTDLELKPLIDHLEYVFLEEPSFLLVIISSKLFAQNKNKLVFVLKKHKGAFAWKTPDIPGICLSFCKHKIQLLNDKKPVVQKQRRLNPNMQEVVKKEIVKLLDTRIIYPIVDSPWVSPIHYVPKKSGIIVVTNENDEHVPIRTITGWRVCIDYRKPNEATTKDHFPLPFMD